MSYYYLRNALYMLCLLNSKWYIVKWKILKY